MLNAMDLNELAKLLAAYKSGELETREALDRIKNLHFEDIGFARVDHSRPSRQGFPEVRVVESENRGLGAAGVGEGQVPDSQDSL